MSKKVKAASEVSKVYRLDEYQIPDYTIKKVDFLFELDETKTRVHSRLLIERQTPQATPLRLSGERMQLISIALNGQELDKRAYQITPTELILAKVPARFTLEMITQIDPTANTQLDGLYYSNKIFCTQNEPQGMRKITYFIDRPDVMAIYTTRIIADAKKYPVLLANGNPVAKRQLPDGRLSVTWKDPFPKPSYLFALVAGDLGMVQDYFTTRSGRRVSLQIYCDRGNEDKCGHAMESLKWSMKWDEETFNLEYDLDIYMIVAVDAFNMGAMENKGLNIFNAAYVLAKQQTATDSDFLGITGVIGHEYFHNWTGNRVTCRDWFQLTLKEGLTVFRDQQFSGAMGSPAVKRIEDVLRLRAMQFSEDAGPNAHPIKPKSYMEINNFYTATVYEKGSEVIRMLATLLGEAQFKKGIEKYFELFDGQAVRTEDFIYAMEVVSKRDLTQFKTWYDQVGTPRLGITTQYHANTEKFICTILQKFTGDPQARPLHVPLRVALYNHHGKALESRYQGQRAHEHLLEVTEFNDQFLFEEVSEAAIISVNRGHTAPIYLDLPHTIAEQLILMAHDNDSFNRFEVTQNLWRYFVQQAIEAQANQRSFNLDPAFIKSYEAILDDSKLDPAFKALLLSLPSTSLVAEYYEVINYQQIHQILWQFKQILSTRFEAKFLAIYKAFAAYQGPYHVNAAEIGRRDLANRALEFLVASEKSTHFELAFQQFQNANNMNDQYAGLRSLVDYETPLREQALQQFYQQWKHERLVIDKWFALQAGSTHPQTLSHVVALSLHPDFDWHNPNRVRSLYRVFARNSIFFHRPSGEGYEFIVDAIIKLDKINAQMAAMLAKTFDKYQRVDAMTRNAIERAIGRLLANQLSSNCYEVASKILA